MSRPDAAGIVIAHSTAVGDYTMNPVLKEMLRTGRATDAAGAHRPLVGPMSVAGGELIREVFQSVKPDVSVETGFAYGVATLYACAALEQNQKPARHIVIDPLQSVQFERIGLLNIERAGYGRFVELLEAPSEVALPDLYHAGTRIQAAIIDGFHTFDHALVDFFYINKMLEIGGVVIFDDVNLPSLARLVAHVRTYPCYRVLKATAPPRAPNLLVSLRRSLNRHQLSMRHMRDNPRVVALQKTAPDTRDWDWHVDF